MSHEAQQGGLMGRHGLVVRTAFALLSTALLSVAVAGAQAAHGTRSGEPRLLQPADVHRLRDVGNLAISPDGEWVAYTVRTTDVEADRRSTDLFMVRWDGSERIQLTHTEKGSEGSPRFSPDGKYLGFVAARGGDDDEKKDPKAKSQVWLLDRRGGEAQRLTELPGGVSSFEWSPDGSRLAIVSHDPDPEELDSDDDSSEAEDQPAETDSTKAGKAKKPKTRRPIVVDRYRFKQDRAGYLVDRYDRIYVFDVAAEKAELLTPGEFDSEQPAWSPDGAKIAFASKRPTTDEPDPDRTQNSDIFVIEAKAGAEPKRLTDWGGADSQPVWSPDGTKIAYIQGPTEKYDFYDPSQLAVVSTSGGKPVLPTEELDRSVRNARWSLDGSTVYFGFDDDRERFVGAVPAEGGKIERRSVGESTLGRGVVRAFEVGKLGVAVLATFPHRPTEIYRLADGLALSDHNRELREEIAWANVRGFDATGEDGVRVGAMLLEPPGYEAGRAYPTIAFIHGGPVGQDAFEFDWMAQAFAAAGYVVVQPNYRGSSGRGASFSRAIYARWGSYEIQDIHTILDALVEQGLADPKRLAIGGWSYGGINTNYAIATDTRFAAAVSGAGIANLLTGYGTDQYIWQYEGEIGKPWEEESLTRYLELSYPFLHADRIRTPTLFMCGEKDFNVPLINSEQMYQALRSLGVPTELVIYPGQFHGLSVPSYIQDRVERMIAWFDRYLKPERATAAESEAE